MLIAIKSNKKKIIHAIVMFQRTFTYNKLREKIHTSNLTKKKKETWKGL